MIVIQAGPTHLVARYKSDPHGRSYGTPQPRRNSDFVRIETKETITMSKLYQTITEPNRFGSFLAHNSAGQIVLEMKGTSGGVEAFNPDAVEEVRPYTVAAVSGGSPRHFITKKGSVDKGDVVLTPTGMLLHIIRLDTKSAKVEGTLKGRKLLSEAVDLPANELEEIED
ncbi:hypothetical protein [Mesorhizobium sp. STM 4661]|uniref:hypothetical protein n=1 Tax=Mesorhizobium sp. STM 4661 TaxID=1297570 RepID=UPI0012F8767E|nr:hypothetical protein [Mesorhizobium sp. STM 4661]